MVCFAFLYSPKRTCARSYRWIYGVKRISYQSETIDCGLAFFPIFRPPATRFAATWKKIVYLLAALSILSIVVYAFYVYPPLLDGAYYWLRYENHPVYGRSEFAAAGGSTFLLAAAYGIWFICRAFPMEVKWNYRILNWAGGIGGLDFASRLINVKLFELLSLSHAQQALFISTLVVLAVGCFIAARKSCFLPFLILAVYGLCYVMMLGALFILYTL